VTTAGHPQRKDLQFDDGSIRPLPGRRLDADTLEGLEDSGFEERVTITGETVWLPEAKADP
jgi:hypothetical protein